MTRGKAPSPMLRGCPAIGIRWHQDLLIRPLLAIGFTSRLRPWPPLPVAVDAGLADLAHEGGGERAGTCLHAGILHWR